MSTLDLTVLFLPFNPEPTTFITTLKGFIFLDKSNDETEKIVQDIINKTLFGKEDTPVTTAIKCMLAAHHDKIPAPLSTNVQESIHFLQASTVVHRLDLVKREDIGTGEGRGHPAWNVYIALPSSNQNALTDWTATIRRVKFVTASYGAGESRKIFLCSICRLIDHPGGMCKFPSQADWITPLPTSSPALDSILNLP